MSLNDSNRQNENLRTELDSMSFHVECLDQAVESQTSQLRELQDTYQRKKTFWASSVRDLKAKIQVLKRDYDNLSEEAHKCGSAIPDIAGMTSAVQSLVLQCEDLKKKFNKETMERKKLYNKVLELTGNIRVFCRCRPLSDGEISAGASSVAEFDTTRDNELSIRVNGSTKKVFKFDRVFSTQDDQVAVFADTAPVVVSVLDGYNVCIFAYGQTGTGKTFTMEGTHDNRGVNYRTLEELFRVANERNGLFKYDISVSVLEVYNEQIRDLLASPTQPGHTVKKLEVKQVAEGVHHVPGLVEAQVHTMNEVWEVLQTGSSARAVGSTNSNEHSSRSHCVLCVMVKGENLINGECTRSKLWLVDLAGSERIAKTDVQGERLKEAQSINKSLSSLGDVISALATKNSHIPYRNSKLTHLLQDSLGGDSKTLMFVQISPNESDIGETLSSLNFATRVRGIELGPARKQFDSSELLKYKQMFEKAKQEGKAKDDMMKKMDENMQNLDGKLKGREQLCRNFQEKVKELEGQHETRLREQQQQWEKEIMQYGEKFRGKEQMCRNLQEKVKDLEAQLEAKVKGQRLQAQKELEEQLEIRLKEQGQQAEKERLQYLEKLKGKEQMCRNLQEKVKDLEAQLEAKVKEQQALPDIVSEKPPPVHQSGGFRSTSEKSAFRKDQSSPVDPLIENRFRVVTPDNLVAGKQLERESLTKADMMDPHLQSGLIHKENNGKLEDMPPRTLSRRTGHVSTCTTTGRANAASATRRVSMRSSSVIKNDISESSTFNKNGGGSNGDHIQHYDTDDSLAVLRGLNTSNRLNRFRRGIHNNVQSRKEKQNTNTDDESIAASATSSSGEQNVPPISGTLKHLSTSRARAKVNSGAQRVFGGKERDNKIKGWTR